MIKTENLTILFVDIAGFTATTSRQSRVENARLLQNFGSTLLPLIKGYKGKLIKTIGDALLITFRSPTDAMLCSMALQDAMHGYNLTAPEGEKIHIRVAANLGEVRVTKNDIFGEPVNVASRIEGVAPADEIYLSEAVYMAMNKAEVPAMDVGSKELAGVPHPVRLYNIPRFSTHRLVAESANAEEKGSELLYPYGGMHYQVRPRSFASLLSFPDRKRITHFFIPGFAVCAVAVIAVFGYQYYRVSMPGPAVTSQPAKDETLPAGTGEIQGQGITEESGSVKSGVRVADLSEKARTHLEDVPEKDAQKSSAAQTGSETLKQAAQKTGETKTASGSVDSGAAKTVSSLKKEYTGSTWTPEPEKSTGTTWVPKSEKTTVSTWTPEPETAKEKSTGSTWAPANNVVSTPAKESIQETSKTDITETESDESEKGADDVISAPITYAAKEDITEWNVAKAKEALSSAQITKVEYNRIIGRLKTEYDKKIRQLKLDLNRGKITPVEYDMAVRKAKLEYSGR
jgi:class 3 adenylate cyclase